MKKYYISLDVGGTNVRIGLIEVNGGSAKVLNKVKTTVNQDYEAGIKDISDHIQKIRGDYVIKGLGCSFPGRVSETNHKHNSFEHIQNWSRKPIAQDLKRATKLEVKLKNDAVGAAFGEALFGIGKNYNQFNFLIWGSGFGGANIKRINGKLLVSDFEPGHHSLDLDGEKCACGRRGCIELLLGGIPLSKKYSSFKEAPDDDKIWNLVAKNGALAILNILMFYPVPVMIFTGGLILERPFLLEKIKTILEKKQKSNFDLPNLMLSPLRDDAALLGGAAFFETKSISID